MNAVIPIVVPMGGFRGGCGDVGLDVMLYFLIPWCVWCACGMIGVGLSIAIDNAKLDNILHKCFGLSVAILSAYTLILGVVFLIRYLIGR